MIKIIVFDLGGVLIDLDIKSCIDACRYDIGCEEAARLLQFFGAETRIFDPSDLPLPDQVQSDDHPAVKELRALSEEVSE